MSKTTRHTKGFKDHTIYKPDLKQRIGYKGPLSVLSKAICRDYKLGKLIYNRSIPEGYEDFNMEVRTSKGKYFVKVFANWRSIENCRRYIGVLSAALRFGVSTPKLFKCKGDSLDIINIGGKTFRSAVFSFIEGGSYQKNRRLPGLDEIKTIARQAALINTMKINPGYQDDSWSIMNLEKAYRKIGGSLSKSDKRLAQPVVNNFKRIDLKALPHAFVHGDIRAGNTLRDSKHHIWIVDFAVSNYYPRLIELGVLATDMCLGKTKDETEQKLRVALEEYQKHIKLTRLERKLLPNFMAAGCATYMINGHHHLLSSGVTAKESRYLYKRGKQGLIWLKQIKDIT
jgi:Ser/Thr protein kinase RdoA (MazF antagonist)